MTHSDITGDTVLLIGSTSGIGARMLERLTHRTPTPHLVLMARNAAELARGVAAARSRGGSAEGIAIDLSDLRSVASAVDDLRRSRERGDIGPIDAALLNAGAQFADRRQMGAQGFELTFTVNVIAQHLLLRSLEPLLAPGGHVVVMGSSTHRGAKASFGLVPDPEWRDPAELAAPDPASTAPKGSRERARGGVAYATSKLALVTVAHDWADRLAGSGRRLDVYDPGLIPGTGLGRDLPAPMYWVWKHIMPAMSMLPGASTARTTARHAVELALGDVFPDLNDGYVEIGRLTAAEAVTFDEDRRRRLWDWLEHAVDSFATR
jgi:NAD(P)-dependent dehydrogenase (short-subunit alcohol dehydrogenase family)